MNGSFTLHIAVLKNLGFFRLWLRHWEVLAPTMLDYKRVAENTTAVTEAIANFYFKGQDILKISGRELSRVRETLLLLSS